MLRILACLLALAVIVPVGCSSKQKSDTDSGRTASEGTAAVSEEFKIPNWVINIPDGGGNKFYGVGVGTYQSPSMMQLGFQLADNAARRQLAETISVTIQAVSRRYMEQVLLPTGEVVEEGLARDVSQVVTNNVMSGIQIIRRDQAFHGRSGLFITYALAEMDLNSVAEATQNELARRVEGVRQRANAAFDELRELTSQEAPNHRPSQPQYDETVPDVAKSAS